MIEPIQIHHADTPTEARARHARIEDRLEELGINQVRTLLQGGGFATQWNPIVHAWLDGHKVKRE